MSHKWEEEQKKKWLKMKKKLGFSTKENHMTTDTEERRLQWQETSNTEHRDGGSFSLSQS